MSLTNLQLVESLRSTLCPACGEIKAAKKTLCYTCYLKLLPRLRNDLYSPLSDGYGEAVATALHFLKVQAPHLPSRPESRRPA